MMISVIIGALTIFLLMMSLFYLSPKASLASAFLGLSLLGFSLYFYTGWMAGIVIVILSLFAILGIALQSIMYFDLEKEFQQQYKKDITSILSIIFSVIIFGILLILISKNKLTKLYIDTDIEKYNWESIAHSGEYIFVGMAILVMLMIISGIALISKQGEKE